MHSFRWLSVSISAATLLIACGGGPAGGGAGGGGGDIDDGGAGGGAALSPAEQFEARYHDILRAQCEVVFASLTWASTSLSPDYAYALVPSGSVEGCVAQFSAAIIPPPRLDALREAIGEGRVLFDPEQATACADSLATDLRGYFMPDMLGLLNYLFQASPACADLLVGTLEVNASCTLEDECAPGLECELPDASCGGTCVASAIAPHSVPLGEACFEARECAVGSTCFVGVCRSIAIVADLEVGDPCHETSIADDVYTVRVCESGLGCAKQGPDEVCAERLAIGANCTPDQVCAQGHFCLPDPQPAATFSCQPMVFETSVGAACANAPEDGPLAFCDASQRLHCTEAMECASIGDGSEGSSCFISDEHNAAAVLFPCDPGLYCALPDLECAQQKAATEPCVLDTECQSGACLGDVCAESYCDAALE